jgi:hypothetical protein
MEEGEEKRTSRKSGGTLPRTYPASPHPSLVPSILLGLAGGNVCRLWLKRPRVLFG